MRKNEVTLGFEPRVGLPTTVFKTVTFNHSVMSPDALLLTMFEERTERIQLFEHNLLAFCCQ